MGGLDGYGPMPDGRYLLAASFTMFVSSTAAVYPHCLAIGAFDGESLSVFICRYGGGQHVLCKSVLHSAQCACDVGRKIYIHGLCKNGIALADYIYDCHGVLYSVDISFLISNSAEILNRQRSQTVHQS